MPIIILTNPEFHVFLPTNVNLTDSVGLFNWEIHDWLLSINWKVATYKENETWNPRSQEA